MKQKKYILSLIIVLMSLFSYAGSEGPGDPGINPNPGDPPLGGGAPIGSGTILLIGMGIAYSTYKLHKTGSKKTQEMGL